MPCYNYEGDELKEAQAQERTALDDPQWDDKTALSPDATLSTEQGLPNYPESAQPEDLSVSTQEHQAPVDNSSDHSFPPPHEQDRVVLTSISTQGNSYQRSHPAPSEDEAKAYAFAYRLTTFASIAAAVSIAIGGVPLSLIALICAFIAYSKIKKYIQDAHAVMVNEWKQLYKLIRVAFGISCLALVLNTISTYVLFTSLQDAGYGSLFGLGPSGSPAPSGSSVWG